jgi:phosphatidylglycerophosphatase A
MKRHESSIWKLIVSGFGLGFISFAPGTMGAIGALVPAILILEFAAFPSIILGCLSLIFSILGIIGSNKLKYQWGKDSSRIVVDEMVGMWVSLLWIKSGWIPILSAFFLFRFFDITKPLGIRKTEQLPEGFGVMVDDILAGIYTNLILQITFRIIPAFI